MSLLGSGRVKSIFMCYSFSSIAERITAYSSLITMFVAVISFFCVLIEYRRLRKREKAEVLQHYNERYSSDPNIKAVVKRLMINEQDINNENVDNIYENEMFMRFFEELYVQVKANRINLDEANYMFAYYAKKVDELKTKFVSDYNNDDWKEFRMFIENCNLHYNKL